MTEHELTDEQAAELGRLDEDDVAALTALTDDGRAALAALDDDERAALAEVHDEHDELKSEPVKKAAAKKAAAKKAAAPKHEASARPAMVEPPHPAIDHEFFAAAGYHSPTIPAVVAAADEREGFKVADVDQHATRIAFEDGSRYEVEPASGRIADRL